MSQFYLRDQHALWLGADIPTDFFQPSSSHLQEVQVVGTTDPTVAEAPTVMAPTLLYCIVHSPDLSLLPFTSINQPFLPALRDAQNIKKLAKDRWGDTAYLVRGWSRGRKDGAVDNLKPSNG